MSRENNRDYSTISPSARALLLLKGYTDIPFTREAAELISQPERYAPDWSIRNVTFWGRVLHFEARYKSIGQLLNNLPVNNILELSSGFSFRGLDTTLQSPVHYIDTDLPEVINDKLKLLTNLHHPTLTGRLETLPLNALQETAFNAVTDNFEPGPIAIVNEGLLVYLDTQEKRKLCANIRHVLSKRGGYWITADAYIKNKEDRFPGFQMSDELQQFFEQHQIEQNKFDSFEDAEAFFNAEGFVIDQEAAPDPNAVGSLKYFMMSAGKEQLENLGRKARIRKTWRLKLA